MGTGNPLARMYLKWDTRAWWYLNNVLPKGKRKKKTRHVHMIPAPSGEKGSLQGNVREQGTHGVHFYSLGDS